MDKGGLIVGQTTHGLFIDKNRFKWGGSLELNPQLFMAYKVDIAFKRTLPKALKIVEIGPYIIISVPEGEKLSEYINFSPSQIWAFRNASIKVNQLLIAVAIILSLTLILALILGLKIKAFIDF